MSGYETTLLVKQEVFVYQIPPRASAKGFRAADWNLGAPDWTGRLKLKARDKCINIRLEDRSTGDLYANCPVDAYPGVAVEGVTDSSRYFVLRIMDDGGRTAFIGIGFADRSDSFDMNVALQDHFKWVKKENQIEKEKTEPTQKLDLGFKEGQTIKIKMNITRKHQDDGDGDDDDDDSPSHRPKARTPAAGLGLLPPPPGSGPASLPPQTAPAPATAPATATATAPATTSAGSEWGDFTSANSSAAAAGSDLAPSAPSNNWVQF